MKIRQPTVNREPNPDKPEKCLKLRNFVTFLKRPFCLPRGIVTVGSAKTLIENFRQFENVKYYLEL